MLRVVIDDKFASASFVGDPAASPGYQMNLVALSRSGHHKGPKLAPWQVRTAKAVMEASLTGTILISDVAARCGLSPSYFVRAFRNTVGQAPYDWFLARRILRARRMLCATAFSIAEIALECGFVDQSHFAKTFKRRTGVTPLQWRRTVSRNPGIGTLCMSINGTACRCASLS